MAGSRREERGSVGVLERCGWRGKRWKSGAAIKGGLENRRVEASRVGGWTEGWRIAVGRREWVGSAGGFELKRVKDLEVREEDGGLGAGSRRAERRRMGVLGRGTWSGKWLVGRRNK